MPVGEAHRRGAESYVDHETGEDERGEEGDS